MKKLLFIINPLSGKARIKNRLYEIINYYSDKDFLVTVYPTRFKGDGYLFLVNNKMEYDLIVCSGGDGTLNETISGILDSRKNILLGYLPSGSTNDFGKSVGIPINFKQALRITCGGRPYNIDVGQFNERYFIYIAGFGALTNISYLTPQKMKNAFGYMAYVLQSIKAISELKAYKLCLNCNGKITEGSFIVGLVTNSFSVAGFKNPFSTMTKLNDGMFEILLIKRPKNLIAYQSIITSLLNKKLDSEYIIYIQASKIEIESEPINWTVDGEYGGEYDKISITNIPQALKILVGNNFG